MFCARVLAMNWLGLKTFQGCCVIAHIKGEILFCSTFYTCVCNKKIRPSGSREKPISRMLPREYRDLPLCFFEHSVIQMSVMMGWLRSRLRVIAPTWSCSRSHSAFLSLSTRERKCMIVLLTIWKSKSLRCNTITRLEWQLAKSSIKRKSLFISSALKPVRSPMGRKMSVNVLKKDVSMIFPVARRLTSVGSWHCHWH